MSPDPAFVERFREDLDRIAAPNALVGIAVSGGADSTALLFLAVAARPGQVAAATVDHRLRAGSETEAEQVSRLCSQLGVPHLVLRAQWAEPPATAVQQRARDERYRLLAAWALDAGLDAVLTGHHADDQAETFLMRLARGAGVNGLAGMRATSRVPGSDVALLRPLLRWRRFELEAICAGAGITPIEDPSNRDHKYERVRVRQGLREAKWLDAPSIADSAAYLADADSALDWAAGQEWRRAVKATAEGIVYAPGDAPPEILRRIVSGAIAVLASEGPEYLRGRELDRVLVEMKRGRTATLRGVRCSGGAEWRFKRAAARRG